MSQDLATTLQPGKQSKTLSQKKKTPYLQTLLYSEVLGVTTNTLEGHNNTSKVENIKEFDASAELLK